MARSVFGSLSVPSLPSNFRPQIVPRLSAPKSDPSERPGYQLAPPYLPDFRNTQKRGRTFFTLDASVIARCELSKIVHSGTCAILVIGHTRWRCKAARFIPKPFRSSLFGEDTGE
jgi:hypothetical protein